MSIHTETDTRESGDCRIFLFGCKNKETLKLIQMDPPYNKP